MTKASTGGSTAPAAAEGSRTAGSPYPAEPIARKKKKRLREDILRVLLIAAVFAVAALALRSQVIRDHLFDIHQIRESLHPDDSLQDQILSYFIFIGAGAVLICFGMPRIWVSTVAGSIYGAALGIMVSMGATLIGATGTWFLGKSLLRGVVRRRFGGKVNLWAERFRENAFMWTLYARLFPLSNATATSLICGTCKVSLRTYTLANLIGFLPLTIVFAVFGSAVAKGKFSQFLLGTLLFLLAVLGQYWWTRHTNRKAKASSA